jgi:hypothetical protein
MKQINMKHLFKNHLFYCLFITVLLLSWQNAPSNFLIGKWKYYKLESFDKKRLVPDSIKQHFSAEIIFKADSTYTKTINGKTTKGRYLFEKNKLTFLSKNEKNKWVSDYLLRWPKNGNDPFPPTPEIDIIYPELMNAITSKGEIQLSDIDIYYKKE